MPGRLLSAWRTLLRPNVSGPSSVQTEELPSQPCRARARTCQRRCTAQAGIAQTEASGMAPNVLLPAAAPMQGRARRLRQKGTALLAAAASCTAVMTPVDEAPAHPGPIGAPQTTPRCAETARRAAPSDSRPAPRQTAVEGWGQAALAQLARAAACAARAMRSGQAGSGREHCSATARGSSPARIASRASTVPVSRSNAGMSSTNS